MIYMQQVQNMLPSRVFQEENSYASTIGTTILTSGKQLSVVHVLNIRSKFQLKKKRKKVKQNAYMVQLSFYSQPPLKKWHQKFTHSK